ncbi:hypothetical protein niasHT_023314 [Heterodera trifolii]|uniref:Major facilitator superfamily (MFS) profile domain-containing protein n=1 Tax=Heterodera trifolii TaxID=157864 RepID=A0ABD2JDK8_9BILA
MQADSATTNSELCDEEYAKINLLLSKSKTPDQILSIFGVRNPFILYIWLSMAMVWALAAMPMMSGAFLIDDGCPAAVMSSNRTTISAKCTPKNGSIRAELGLNENQNYLVDLSTSAFMGGMAVGSAITPIFTDLLGRRSVLVAILLIAGGSGCLSAISTSINVLIALRFVQGLSFSGVSLTNWVLAYECIPKELRALSPLVFGLAWVFGYCLIAPMAYFTSNWRLLVVLVSAPSLLFVVIFYFTIPESFHYLAIKGRIDLIIQWVKMANSFADIVQTDKVEQSDVDQLIEYLEQQKLLMDNIDHQPVLITKSISENGRKMVINSSPFIEKIKTNQRLIKHIAIFILLWVCDAFIYYGVSLFSTKLAGNRYINFTLIALVEVPSYVFSPWLIDRMGRRLFTAFTHLLAALAFFSGTSIFWLPNVPPFVQLCLWLIAKFAIASSFTGLFVYASEVFPTSKRGICMGICTTVSQLCCIILPPMIRVMLSFSPMVPMLFFGGCAFIATFLTFLLPETRGRELPD